MRAQFVNEKEFVRGKDPKHAMNIGLANKIFQSTGKPYGEGGGYSFNYYGPENWMDIIQWLLSQGYNAEETEEVMRSKLMRWASDHAGKADNDCTLEDFIKFNGEPGFRHRGRTNVDDFLDEYVKDPTRESRLQKYMKEEMGGVSAPMATLTNTPGMGNVVPAGTNSFGSGDKFGNTIGGKPYTQASGPKRKKKKAYKKKKINEQNINPHDKLGVAMAKKMGVPLTFKKGKGDKDVEQVKVDEDVDLSTSLMSFDDWAKKFSKK